jgi:DNA (cytosine-5)-methyltransferase 1
MRTFFEFFAAGGIARLGLGDGWTFLYANDVDAGKAASYAANFGGDELIARDVADLTVDDLPHAPGGGRSISCGPRRPART